MKHIPDQPPVSAQLRAEARYFRGSVVDGGPRSSDTADLFDRAATLIEEQAKRIATLEHD